MTNKFNGIDEKIADLAWKVGRMIMKDHTPEEATELANLFVEEMLMAMDKYCEFKTEE